VLKTDCMCFQNVLLKLKGSYWFTINRRTNKKQFKIFDVY